MTTRRQLAVVLFSAVVVGATLGAWLTVAFVRENLGGDFIDVDTGELHFNSISFLFQSLSATLAALRYWSTAGGAFSTGAATGSAQH